jgi:hypothetical protein
MPLFSEREGLTTRQVIVDDAPQWLRDGFFSQVLRPFLHLDQSSNPFASSTDAIGSPIGVKSLTEKISTIARISTPPNYRSDVLSFSALQEMLSVLPWFHFYNSIELVGQLLRSEDNKDPYHSYPTRHFQKFRVDANKFLEEAAVGWQLHESGKLQRILPVDVTGLESSVVSANTDSPIASHITKARGFINQHPCDSANAIKECVCAVESFAKTLAPKAATLGDAVKQLSKQKAYPPLMLTLIDKLYAFTNAEPGVRHGSPQEERVIRADAEFSYATSLAIIRYLRDSRE